MTTETKDAMYMCDLADGSLSGTAAYDFYLRNANGALSLLRAEFSSFDGSARLTRTPATSELGKCYTHHPTRVWDAMVVLKRDNAVTSVNSDALDNFLLSVCTNAMAPSFTAVVPPNTAFTVETVLAKREYAKSFAAGRLVVTEVQDLYVNSPNAPRANLQAVCESRELMTEDGRLWWEARVEVEDLSCLQDAVALVEHLDGVGYGSVGPWVRRKSEGLENVVPEVPFW